MRKCYGDSADGTEVKEFEPHVAVNPRNRDNLVVAWMSVKRLILLSASFDGGATWTRPWPAPVTKCAAPDNSDVSESAGDPFVAFDAAGNAYVAALSGDLSLSGMEISVGRESVEIMRSEDGGRSWVRMSPAIPDIVKGGSEWQFIDNIGLAADAEQEGTVYLATTGYYNRVKAGDFGAEGFKKMRGSGIVSVSRDGGHTWSKPVDVGAAQLGERVSAPQLLAVPGAVHLIYYIETLTAARLEIATSTDQGRTWTRPTRITDLVRKPEYNAGGSLATKVGEGEEEYLTAEDIVSVAAAPRGREITVAFADAREDKRTLNVHVVRSRDGGMTWGTPVAVTAHPGAVSFLANVAVGEAGRSAVTYLEIDPARVSKGHFPVEMNFVEFDGDKIARREVLDRFDTGLTGPTGDYQGLVTGRDGFVAVYVRASCSPETAGCEKNRMGGIDDVVALRVPWVVKPPAPE